MKADDDDDNDNDEDEDKMSRKTKASIANRSIILLELWLLQA